VARCSCWRTLHLQNEVPRRPCGEQKRLRVLGPQRHCVASHLKREKTIRQVSPENRHTAKRAGAPFPDSSSSELSLFIFFDWRPPETAQKWR
jgi:hypothetical protein